MNDLLTVKNLTCSINRGSDSYHAEEDGDLIPLWTDLSFCLPADPKGRIIVIEGPSGSGKSVLLKTIAGLIGHGDKSILTLKGESMDHIGMPTWRSRILYLPQHAVLQPTAAEFEKTIKGFKSQVARQKSLPVEDIDSREIAKSFGISYDRWDADFQTLSGGEAQRIAVAIALSVRPDLILFDEPTTALDETAMKLVEEIVMQRKQAGIWVTHNKSQIERLKGSIHQVISLTANES